MKIYPNKANLSLNGKPKASFTFWALPSWNTTVNQHYKSRGNSTKKLREEGCALALELRQKLGLKFSSVLVNRALVVVKIYTPTTGIMDVYNVNIKAVSDGFTDAGIWADDEWATVPVTLFMWAGMDEDKVFRKKRTKRRAMTRTVIEIYELGTLKINGDYCPLPLGRKRNAD